MERCNIIGVNVNVTNMKNTLSYIKYNLNHCKGNYICIANVHTTVTAHDNQFYRKIQNEAFLTLPDGKPLSILSKKKGFVDAERVTGPELMEEILKASEEKGYTHFFYGSTDEVLCDLRDKIIEKYPKVKIKGLYAPPFRELTKKEDEEIVNTINEARADFLWVGLGAPKQEIWMYEHRNKVNSLMIGVGAAFDYHSGKIKRAPKWMQNLCLEWLYRLMQEPRRLFKRYVTTNIKFLYYVGKK